MEANDENFLYNLLGRQYARFVSIQARASALEAENAQLKKQIAESLPAAPPAAPGKAAA